MREEWTVHAAGQRDLIAKYIFDSFGERRAMKFRQEVDEAVDMLLRYPTSGVLDPLFSDRPVAYRSVIVGGRSKMVYRIDEECIHIVGFWDCRQDPEDQASWVE